MARRNPGPYYVISGKTGKVIANAPRKEAIEIAREFGGIVYKGTKRVWPKKNPMAKKAKKRKRSAKHRLKNPRPVALFKTKAAARKYAKEHARPGVKFSIKKLKKGR
jgi:hypothetical protein